MNKIIKAFTVLFCTFSFFNLQGQSTYRSYLQDPAAHAREHNVDMDKMVLELKFKPEKGLVIGKVTYTFGIIRKSIDSIWLDAPGIHVKSLSMDQKACKYDTTAEAIILRSGNAMLWNTRHSITIEYEATPRKGIYFIGWDDPTNRSRKQIWTQGEGVDNRYWIPSYDDPDDKLVTEEIVTFDKKYKVLGNGTKLEEKDHLDGTKTWHYRISHPHAFYLVMLGIGEYDIATAKATDGTPLGMWYYPSKKEALEPTYRNTAKIMDFLEKETGVKYPWESYSQIPVQNFLYGAMENTTATIFGDFYYVDKRECLDKNYMGVNAHEMAHQWFGDLITGRGPQDIWLQESFATHYAKLADHALNGEDAYQWNKRGEANAALEASKENRNPIVFTGAGTARIYQKGSFVLDMLKYVVGKEDYDRVITHYLKTHAYGSVQTYDLYVAFHDLLGLNLDWFFDEWLYRGGEPEYKVSYSKSEPLNDYTLVNVKQVHERNEVIGLFKMPITVEVHYTDGTMDSRKEIVEKEEHIFRIPNKGGKKIDFVIFDPNSYILKKVTFERSFEELQAQALKATNMIDRFDALQAMKGISLAIKKQTLLNIFHKEKFHSFKGEVLLQLMGDKDPAVQQIFREALNDREVKVRLSAVVYTDTIPSQLIPDFEKMLGDSSYKICELSLNKLCTQNPKNAEKYLGITDKQFGPDNALRIEWLKRKYVLLSGIDPALKSTDDATKKLPVLPSAMGPLRELTDMASNAFEFRTRANAIKALKSLNYVDNNVAANMLNAYTSNNGRLSGPTGEVITYLIKNDDNKKIFSDYIHSKTWTKWEKEMITKLIP